MKKINFLLLVLIGLFSILSCEKDEERAVVGVFEKPAFTAPGSGSTYVLLEANATDTMAFFEWMAADFGFQSAVSYTLQIAFKDSSFSTARELATTNRLKAGVPQQDVNSAILKLKAVAEFPAIFKVRVKAVLHSAVKTLYSDSILLTITPYPPPLTAPPVYLLGDGSRAGWNNTKAVELIYMGDDKYYIIDSLWDAKSIKFIAELGKWAPQWGTDASGTWSSGNLVYRPTESVPDPPSIPSPPTTGVYKIVFDKGNLKYTVTPAGLYMLGDATTAGWDNNNPLVMNLAGPNKFSITTALAASKNYKFLEVIGQWAPQYGTNASGTTTGGKLVYRPTEASPDPPAIPSPATAGNYKVEVDLREMTYTCTQAK